MPKPKKTPDIISAIRHRDLFGSLPAFASLDTWGTWLTWLKAAFALPMDEGELAIYRQCTGRTDPPSVPPREIFMVSGRRSGKSFISSLVATYLACFSNYAKHLNASERAVILVLARDRDQGRVCFAYIAGIIREIAPLAALVVSERADEIELSNGTVIMVKTSDFRSVRGLTLAAVICDEVAFWDSQGVSPDTEIFRALKPAMATIPNSKLIAISSPYAVSGVLYEAHRDFFGKNDSKVLVWQSETRVMNPLIDAELIQRELERDPDSAKSEWLATFRDDLEAAFSFESLRACVIPGRSELPSSSAIAYSGFNPRFHVSNQPISPIHGSPVFIGTTLVSPWASVIAQNQGSGVQILAAFVSEMGGLRYHLQQQVMPWLAKHAQWAAALPE